MCPTRGSSSRHTWIYARTTARAPLRSGMDDPTSGLRPARALDG